VSATAESTKLRRFGAVDPPQQTLLKVRNDLPLCDAARFLHVITGSFDSLTTFVIALSTLTSSTPNSRTFQDLNASESLRPLPLAKAFESC
jgi:hypothetical protein